jgi:hypothetical protein
MDRFLLSVWAALCGWDLATTLPLVPLLHLVLLFPIVLFWSTALLAGMTGIPLQGAMTSDFSVAWQ